MPTRAARPLAEAGSTSSASSRARIGSSDASAAAAPSITSSSRTPTTVLLKRNFVNSCGACRRGAWRPGRLTTNLPNTIENVAGRAQDALGRE